MAEYINRAELISNLKQFAPEQLTPLIESLIQKQPTADVVEVKHGKWEYQTSDEYSDEYWSDYKCSFCGNIITALSDEDELYDYCPYCGARMDGDTE